MQILAYNYINERKGLFLRRTLYLWNTNKAKVIKQVFYYFVPKCHNEDYNYGEFF